MTIYTCTVYSQLKYSSVNGSHVITWSLVVTGATEGIGRAFAEELAKRGLNIVLLDVELEKLNEVSAEIGRSAVSVGSSIM